MCSSTLTQLEVEQDGTRIRLERQGNQACTTAPASTAQASTAQTSTAQASTAQASTAQTSTGSMSVAVDPAALPELVSRAAGAAPAPAAGLAADAASGAVVGAKEIKAPMVGTYHTHASKKIEPGTKLKTGEVVCIIEAMKLMNEISITEPGEIVTVEVADGDMIEYGQVLFTYN